MLKLDNETLLSRLYSREVVRIFTPESVRFNCTCSYERCENAIRLLEPEELEQELDKNSKIMVRCEFCNQEYIFDKSDVNRIFKSIPPVSNQMH